MENLDHLTEHSDEMISKDKLEELTDFCLLYKSLQSELQELETKLKEKQKELEDVSRISIPNILNKLMLSELKLSTGEKIIVEEKIKASIAKKNTLLAYKNMILTEGGNKQAEEKVNSLFKTETVLENSTDETLQILINEGISYDLKRSIHHQTLSKYCRGLLESGKPIPEGIAVFQYQETKIK